MNFKIIQNSLRRACGFLAVTLSMALVGCAGTVKHMGPAPTGDEQRVQGIAKVVLAVSPQVKADAAGNAGFNQEELARRVRERLVAKQLVGVGASQYVDVVVTDVRIRSTVAAIMLGFMAGDDHISGRVRLLSDSNQELRAFDISASYALGGLVGGQDGARMPWLYDKFAELVLQELEKLVSPVGAGGQVQASTTALTNNDVPLKVAVTRAAPMPVSQVAPVPAPQRPSPVAQSVAAATPVSPMPASPVVSSSSGSPMIVLPPPSAADKVLENSTIAHRYHIYLSRPKPKAFAVSESGGWWMAWGESLNPMVKETIPQRALRGCQERSQTPCVLYAVDDKVVFGQGLEGKR